MKPTLTVSRRALLLDELRIERCRRLPELGPRLLFFSGGTALRGLCRRLKHYTENSVHLITPFDSGGSSAHLRTAFSMPAVGDLRNRLMALADETERGNPDVYRLFSHRLAKDAEPAELVRDLRSMVSGDHPLVAAVAAPLRRLVRTHLRVFAEAMPPDFDLREASVGNLILAGGYLNNERDIESVLFLFSRLVNARGEVALTAVANSHLRAELEDGSIILGQHRLTGRESPPIRSRVVRVSLVDSLTDPKPVAVEIDERIRRHIERADLICYPMGSFYSSLVANLLPAGVGGAIRSAGCPKIYVPSTGFDSEQIGGSVGSAVEQILEYVRRDAGAETEPREVLDGVLLDERDDSYAVPLELSRIERLGIPIARLPLAQQGGSAKLDPEELARTLVSIC